MTLSQIKEYIKKFWNYLKQDTWHSWLVSLIILYLVIRLVFFPLMSFVTGSPLPLVIVESCSMYHHSAFDNWWDTHSSWYEAKDISKEEFSAFSYKNGLNKGDILLVLKRDNYNEGDIIIFKPNPESTSPNPIIHRIISENPFATKGDNNLAQLSANNNLYRIDETSIPTSNILGKAVLRIPLAGWLKLIWIEPFRAEAERGLCVENQNLKTSTLRLED